MEKIDLHHHLLEEDGYADHLVAEMDKLGIQKTCISGLGIGKGKTDNTDYSFFNLGKLSPDNDDVLAAVKKYPGRLVGMASVKPGEDSPEIIGKFRDLGFLGLKITRTKKAYNDDCCMPLYAEADRLNMPILFHTGMVLVTPFDAEDDVCSERMRPIKLDRVARRFPNLKIIIAHMGYPWFNEAVVMIRYHKNVYADLSGASMGWRSRKSPDEYLRDMFWPGAFDKLVFGTDTHYSEMGEAMYDQQKILKLLNMGGETMERFFHKNAEYLLNL
ncbi:MAG: amidohydrolase family protein [Treponema sp.]|jgi:predicted TIM-barrel fold metal-dependent hydrolase|nr:amidohydrolase family protein [Treponema sp.]